LEINSILRPLQHGLGIPDFDLPVVALLQGSLHFSCFILLTVISLASMGSISAASVSENKKKHISPYRHHMRDFGSISLALIELTRAYMFPK